MQFKIGTDGDNRKGGKYHAMYMGSNKQDAKPIRITKVTGSNLEANSQVEVELIGESDKTEIVHYDQLCKFYFDNECKDNLIAPKIWEELDCLTDHNMTC